jgi:hypothetical protein
MRYLALLALLVTLAACAPAERYKPERDGGIGGTGQPMVH